MSKEGFFKRLFSEKVNPPNPAHKLVLVKDEDAKGITFKNVTLKIPNTDETLIENINLTLKPGDRLAITGSSGSGKSSMLRTLGGMWPFGEGEVTIPAAPGALRIAPQKPYIPFLSIRAILAYGLDSESINLPPQKEKSALAKAWEGVRNFWNYGIGYTAPTITARQVFTDEEYRKAIIAAGGSFPARVLPLLDEQIQSDLEKNPTYVSHGLQLSHIRPLSGGEEKRLTFARILLQKPKIVVLDELVSGLDEGGKEEAYQTLIDTLPKDSIIISVVHDKSLLKFHNVHAHIADKKLNITRLDEEPAKKAAPEAPSV